MHESVSPSLQLILGILRSEDELTKIGGHRWPELAWRLRSEAEALEPWDEESVPRVAERMLEIVTETLPAVSPEWLRAAGDLRPISDRKVRSATPTRIVRNAREWIGKWLRPQEAHYRFLVDSPDRLALASVADLGVTVDRTAADTGQARMEEVQVGIDLRFRLHSVGVSAHPAESIHTLSGDLEALHVAFQLRGLRAGRGTLFLEVTQGRRLIFIHRVDLEIYLPTTEDRERSPIQRRRHSYRQSLGGAVAPQPELVIGSYLRDRSEYFVHFDFHNPEGFQISATKQLKSSPEAYWKDLGKDFELLSSQEDSARALRQIGQRLFADLFPEELRPALGHLIAQGIETVQVRGDNLWIPWEILVPFGQFFDTPSTFLGELFAMARWHQPGDGGTRPRAVLDLQAARLLMPRAEDLPGVALEEAWLTEELTSRGVACASVVPPNKKTFLEQLCRSHDPPVHLWHFGGHGQLEADDADRAVLVLDDGQLQPLDFLGDTAQSLRRVRPLVFLNACGVGLGGWGATSMGGWMYRLVGHAGVGAVIAPMWSIADEDSLAFMQAFYRDLPGDAHRFQTLGEAVRQARSACGHSATAMAYTAFGDVNARVGLPLGC